MNFDLKMHRKKGLPCGRSVCNDSLECIYGTCGHLCVIQKLCSCDDCINQPHYHKEASSDRG